MSATDLLIPVVVFAVLGSGLMAGLFFVFSNAVMPALARLAPERAVAFMQTVNVTILNPLFLSLFVGTALACAFILVGGLVGWLDARPLLLIGAVLYLVGTFGVTAAGNVPLNDALEALEGEEAVAFWPEYAARWTRWNHVRTVAAIAATACLTVGLLGLTA
jgi:uncharacterized membrane protein